jgi:hypothetical protein
MNHMSESKAVDYRWQSLCKVGGIAALMIAVLQLGEIVVYAFLPRCNTAIEDLALFRD